MSEIDVSRRGLLVTIVAGVGAMTAEAGQHTHHAVAEEKKATGVYAPKALNAHEYKTLGVLAEIIMPGASKAGAAEFIDMLAAHNDELKAIYTGGLAWLDREMQKRYAKRFVEAAGSEQTAMLDLIAYHKDPPGEMGPGIAFFDWARKMTVDAYFTSKAGVEELGYKGNVGMTEFQVPKPVLDHILKNA
jgi:gluconate 2-dehydrogenase gamma chain